MPQLKERPSYLAQMEAVRDNGFVKVMTGMRRCGKSSLLELFARHLRASGVDAANVVQADFESFEFESVHTYQDMYRLLASRLAPSGRTYLLLDEVQLVDGWERAVNALRVDKDVDVYLTGSNAHLLSSQLATLLSGRQLEIRVYPLTFSEFLAFVDAPPSEASFDRFVRYGGLPPVVEQGTDHRLAVTVLAGVYGTVLVRDIAQHAQVRNQLAFDDVARFLADTAGSSVSTPNIGRRLASAHRKTSGETVERYVQALVDAFLFYRAARFDAKGGEYLRGLAKYYPSDLGIKNMMLGFRPADYGFALENVVHNELLARGCDVAVGKVGGLEVDFVATRTRDDMTRDITYVQVTASMLDPTTRARELRPFASLGDVPGRRLVITLDRLGLGEAGGGVEVVNALDWLTTGGLR